MNEKNAIEIEVRPIKKIVIFECVKFSNNEFFKRIELMAISGQLLFLNWAEGVVFVGIPYQPDSEIMIQEALNGTIYWASCIFSFMSQYQPIRKFGAREIPIVDQTSVFYLRQVAQWLRHRNVQA
jgi:hypothetical protein